jgi:Leucine-rich repeat (LRR) protein
MNDYCLCINCVINRNNECDKCQIYNKRIIANDIYFQYTTTNLKLHANNKIFYHQDNFKEGINPNQIIIINFHNFPETLEKIDISYDNYAIFDVGIKYKVMFHNMPEKLLELKCHKLNTISFTNLPSELKKLVCIRCGLDKLDNLPLSLKYLDCSHNNITNLDFLPEGLEYLNCSSNKLNKLEDLPLSLKYLITGDNNIVNYFSLPQNLIKLNDAHFNDVSTYQQSIKLLSNYKQYACKFNANKYI